MTRDLALERLSRARHSSRSRLLELPRELRDMIYDWVIDILHDEALADYEQRHLHRGMLTLFAFLVSQPIQALGLVNRQISREICSRAHKKCKIISELRYTHTLELRPYFPDSPISTWHFAYVRNYEIVLEWPPFSGSVINHELSCHVNAAVYFFTAVENLTIRFDVLDSQLIVGAKDNDDNVIDFFMNFTTTNMGRIHSMRKVVTVGFHDLNEPLEYLDRTDRLNENTLRLEEVSSLVRDIGYWVYLEDMKDGCAPYINFTTPTTEKFSRVYERSAARYEEWEKAGKPDAEDTPHYSLCRELERMDSAEAKRVVEELWKNRDHAFD